MFSSTALNPDHDNLANHVILSKKKGGTVAPPRIYLIILAISSASQPQRPPAVQTAPATRSAPDRESSSSEYDPQRPDYAPRLHTLPRRCATGLPRHQTPRSRNQRPRPTRDTYSL